MNKSAVHQIIDTLTPDAICSELGVNKHSIRYARTAGVFTASWYGPLSKMCVDNGIPCPQDAFNWKTSAKKNSNANRSIQGKVRNSGSFSNSSPSKGGV